jgi:hypothetical protein
MWYAPTTGHQRDMTKHRKPAPNPAVLTVAAITAYAVAAYSVVPLVDPCGWFRAAAQIAPAPIGHRQPTPGDVTKSDPSQTNPTVSPADRALDRALNNICRGCSPTVAVGKVPRYDVAVTCNEPVRDGQDKNTCRKDEEEARNQLNKQWTQFTKAGRSNCIQTTAIGGRPGYVELSACLRIMNNATTLPDAR